MKGEYVEEETDNNTRTTNNNNGHNHLFPKFPHFPPPHLHPFPHPPDQHEPTTTPPPSKKPKTTTTPAVAVEDGGGTIELSRRPRGRPPGSKNKPKPPIVITREPEPAMSPYILELPGGADIVDSLTRFTRRRGIGLCVLTASGAVANVTLKQPSSAAPGATVTFHGRFDILSLSAVVINTPPFSGSGGGGFTISVAGPQGQIVGGKVVGALVSSGTVYVIAASFNSPSYHRLPLEEQELHTQAGGGDGQSSSPASGGGDGGDGGSSSGGGGHMSLYSCHLGTSSSDVIWAAPPTARPPHPPY